MLIGSSHTAGALPSFLTTVLPTISTTLLALDISANFLVALPPALKSCVCLEELNVSFNPLRVLPLFIAHLTSLRVFIADSTGIATLSAPLSALDRLHTLSIRRNRMYSLPSWLCLLVSLQTLLVDGNPFQGPWRALIEPLLTEGPSGSPSSPSTPILPPLNPTGRGTDSNSDTDADGTQLRSQYVASASALNLLEGVEPLPEWFGTIGPHSPSRGQGSQILLDHSLWEKPPESGSGPSTSPVQPQSTPGSSRVTSPFPESAPRYDAEKPATHQRSSSRKRDDRRTDQQLGKWGFLKQMSTGKLAPDTPTHRPLTAQAKTGMAPFAGSTTTSSRLTPSKASRTNYIALIDVRLSSTPQALLALAWVSPEQLQKYLFLPV